MSYVLGPLGYNCFRRDKLETQREKERERRKERRRGGETRY